MITTTSDMPGPAAGIAVSLDAGDDGQRQLLCIALRDAMKAHEDMQAGCASCQAALEVGLACSEHQAREDAFDARRHLYERLDLDAEWRTGLRPREPYVLSGAEASLIRSALGEAIAYRAGSKAAVELALIVAYEELRRAADGGRR
jgi:hypothetical protein